MCDASGGVEDAERAAGERGRQDRPARLLHVVRTLGDGGRADDAAVTLALAASASGRTDALKLKGVVGPGFTITLTQNGHKVRGLKAGTYTLAVADKASIHNFVLEKKSGGFEKAVTSVGFTGTKTVRVKLNRGKWEYYCAPHESSMHGDFTVK